MLPATLDDLKVLDGIQASSKEALKNLCVAATVHVTNSNSNCKYTDLVFRLISTDFDCFVTVFYVGTHAYVFTFLVFHH